MHYAVVSQPTDPPHLQTEEEQKRWQHERAPTGKEGDPKQQRSPAPVVDVPNPAPISHDRAPELAAGAEHELQRANPGVWLRLPQRPSICHLDRHYR
ncbi:hypothetical protein GN958_ATG12201 [Phytophthora infestans]|uniref:Uncharacterized protein n=1 Tax=Phytophthora infestans TaxID=4787 RepID=A0A8S9UGN6_PHYIN|nr:hypothetical protein GN958_ATG12201 [Phytophthora infestans]